MNLTAKIALSLTAALLLILFAVPVVVFLTLVGLLLGLVAASIALWAVVILFENRWSGGDPELRYIEALEVAVQDAFGALKRSLTGPNKVRRSIRSAVTGALPWRLLRHRFAIVVAWVAILPLFPLQFIYDGWRGCQWSFRNVARMSASSWHTA